MTEPHERLREARISRGYATAQEAADAFGWKYPTYSSHENGSRGMKADAVERYSRALKVDPAWLLYGSVRAPKSVKEPATTKAEAQAPSTPGFSEPMAEPFIAATTTHGRTMSRLANELVADARGIALYQLHRPLLDFGFLRGDVLVLDMHPEPSPGSIVLANVAFPQHDMAVTVVCKVYGPHLAYPAGEGAGLPETVSDESVAILGNVRASIRQQVT